MDFKIIGITCFFIIFISIQYTLNKILKELKDIKRILSYSKEEGSDSVDN